MSSVMCARSRRASFGWAAAGSSAFWCSTWATRSSSMSPGVPITPADISGRNLDSFIQRGVPFVFVDRVVPATEACSVSVDDVTGGALATKHLLEAGHTQLAFVNGPTHLARCADRLEGVRKAAAE